METSLSDIPNLLGDIRSSPRYRNISPHTHTRNAYEAKANQSESKTPSTALLTTSLILAWSYHADTRVIRSFSLNIILGSWVIAEFRTWWGGLMENGWGQQKKKKKWGPLRVERYRHARGAVVLRAAEQKHMVADLLCNTFFFFVRLNYRSRCQHSCVDGWIDSLQLR